jgi:predicted Zn-dependent protease
VNRKTLLPFALLTAFSISCATNPVSGRKEFNLVSEQQELALGRQTHQQVIEEFGIYDEKPELTAMVQRIGRKVAAVSDRPDLPWTFTILDTPMVNAMALPGGYIYVTRGILNRMNSEDELAGVIAHEVSHVAARHSAQRMSQAQLAQIGLVLGSVLAGPAATQAYGSLAELGASLLFQRYSRQQETQADLLGTAYMAEAGYNPVGAENMLVSLERLGDGRAAGIERYFMDHPDPAKRVKDVRGKITELATQAPTLTSDPLAREPFVSQLVGTITGNSTLQTTVRDDAVYQRRYGLIVPIPAGWEATVPPGALFTMSPPKTQNTGFIVQEVPLNRFANYGNPQNAIRTNLQQRGLRYLGSQRATTRTGESFEVDVWSGRTQSGNVAVETTQFVQGDRAVILMQISPGLARNAETPLLRTIGSISIDRERARAAEPERMKVGRATSGEDWAEIAARATGRRDDAEEVAEINGFDLRTPVPQGLALKLPGDVIRQR